MGFKINKGKSWKNLGKKTTKEAFSKKNMSSIDQSAKQTFSKKNMSSIDSSWDNTTKSLKTDVSKTTKAAGKGIKRGIDDAAGNMTTWIALGVGGAVLIFLATNDTGKNTAE